jgi:hypothetical protein
MRTLCITPCGQRKIWQKYTEAGPQKARNVYTGPYAGKCIEYAERFYPFSWCILSAKYGFLFPDDIITGPYNVTFNKKSTNPIKVDELLIQIREKGFDKYDIIIVLGGKKYIEIVKNVLHGKGIIAPLSGLGIGQSISKLNSAIIKRNPI